ncbi:hypothetical protein RND81_07G003800 [Saponaria officinalis]|uniref:Protein FAR1-RELATED SEQUENCE n=1 Tax=Saponaria officinalis TaxID=3572 RepID=A0AAW1JM88_SAPOF
MSTAPSNPLTHVSVEDDVHPAIHPLQLSYTPGGSERWTRIVEESFTPKLHMHFVDYDSVIHFYVIYAISCGFEPRLYTTKRTRDGNILRKSIVCNRQGYRDNNRKLKCPVSDVESVVDKDSTVKPKVSRKVKITRIGCPAMMRVVSEPGGGYTVDQFIEFQKIVRKLSLFHKKTIVDHAKLKIGAYKSFQICTQYADEFKNFARDIKCFISVKDAQLFINHFEELSKMKPDFYFAYEVDDEQCLSKVFWADFESRKNYSIFGDAVSFDPTYGTNKYFMVFTPFTGVDHHKRSVTFAASLLAHENEESFVWCFKKFLDYMGQKEPLCIVTDQDPAMKIAIPPVFKSARHRFCMWHIMEKVTEKVGSTICKETDFLSRLNSIVWDYNLEPMVFDQKWLEVINVFNLGAHKWLCNIFAYFRDMPMGGLLRTTQRSESLTKNGDMHLYDIDDELRLNTFQVSYTTTTKLVTYSCKLFESKGLLCRHIFWVFSANLLKSIPEHYILPRWCKVSYRNPLSVLPGNIIADCDFGDVIKSEISTVWSEFYATIGVVKTLSIDHIKALAASLKTFREEIGTTSEALSKDKEIEQLLGCTSSSEVTILPPRFSKKKGSGKRLFSNRKDSIAKAQKPKRLCACCKQMANHDKHNCPQKETDNHTNDVFSLTF